MDRLESQPECDPIMKKLVLLLVLALGAVMPAQAQAQARNAESVKLRAARYDGTWNGSVKCLYDPGLWPEDECDIGLRFEIRGKDFGVWQTVRSKKGEVTQSEVNPGRFSFTRLATNAVAVSIEQGDDEDGTWIETWNFVMTLKDPNHMVVHWTRVVNNLDIPAEKKGSKFSSVGMGVLVRSSP
jgi:hypothetical protein